jgi:chromosome segregation ATPase
MDAANHSNSRSSATAEHLSCTDSYLDVQDEFIKMQAHLSKDCDAVKKLSYALQQAHSALEAMTVRHNEGEDKWNVSFVDLRAQLEQETAHVRETLEEAVAARERLLLDNAEHVCELRKVSAARASAEQAVEDRMRELSLATAEMSCTRKTMEKAVQDCAQLRLELDRSQQALHAAEGRAGDLDKTMINLTSQLDVSQSKVHIMTTDLQALSSEKDGITHQLADAKEQIETLSREKVAWQAKDAILGRQASDARGEVDEMRTAIAAQAAAAAKAAEEAVVSVRALEHDAFSKKETIADLRQHNLSLQSELDLSQGQVTHSAQHLKDLQKEIEQERASSLKTAAELQNKVALATQAGMQVWSVIMRRDAVGGGVAETDAQENSVGIVVMQSKSKPPRLAIEQLQPESSAAENGKLKVGDSLIQVQAASRKLIAY